MNTSDPTPAAEGPPEPDRTDPAFPAESASGADAVIMRVCPTCGREYEGDTRFCPRDGSVLQPKARSGDLVGEIIAERYHVLKKLGTGGMGEVYLAEHVKMGRRCALKVMHPALRQDPEAISRFGREAANASRINHPHVADVYDFGETGDGLIYLAMEYVEGETLSELLRRTGTLDIPRAIELGRQIADALDAAHHIGLVHRDLKPDNIIVARSRDGGDSAKVVDFGIAKAAQGSTQNLTRTGFVVGTLHYMSPEQLMGDPVDGRSDLYSLGCILYEMLVGERPFDGPSGEVVITRRLTEAPPRPRSRNPEVPETLDELVTRTLARVPGERVQSAAELRDALVAHSPARLAYTPLPTPPSPVERAEQPSPPVPAPPTPVPQRERAAEPTAPSPPPQEVAPGTPPTGEAGKAAAGAAAWEGGEEVAAAVPELVPERPEPIPEPGRRGRLRRPQLAAAALIGLLVIGGAVAYAVSGSGGPAPDSDEIALGGVTEPSAPDPATTVPPETPTPGVEEPADPGEQPAEQAQPPAAEPAPPPPTEPAAAPASEPEPAPATPQPPRQAELRISGTLPAGARVTVNNRAVSGRTLSLAPGRHVVRITASGFIPVDSVFTLQAGEQHSWAPQLRRAETPPPAPHGPARPPVAEAAPTVPPPPTPAPESREVTVSRINNVIARYAAAIESREISWIRSVYPALSPAEQSFWETLFTEPSVRGLRAELSNLQPPQIEGQTAQVAFTIQLSYRDSGGAKQSTLQYRATLGRESDGSWSLRSLRP